MNIQQYNRYFKKAFDYQNQGRHDKALKYFIRLTENGNDDPVIWNQRGISHMHNGQYEIAYECFEVSLKINPMNPIVWQNKGDVLINLGRFKAAIKCYDKSLEFDPTNVFALNQKGLCCNNLGEFKVAYECFEEALEIEPGNEVLLDNIKGAKNAIEHEKKGLDPLSGDKACFSCGFENVGDASFCESCGVNLIIEEESNTLNCSECGFENKEGAVFCSGCGKKLAQENEIIICFSCGSENEEDSRFCMECGENLKQTIEEKDDISFVDINNDSEEKIASISGIGPILAKKAIKIRATNGGFGSIDEFCSSLELKPHITKNMETLIICKSVKKPHKPDTSGRIVDF